MPYVFPAKQAKMYVEFLEEMGNVTTARLRQGIADVNARLTEAKVGPFFPPLNARLQRYLTDRAAPTLTEALNTAMVEVQKDCSADIVTTEKLASLNALLTDTQSIAADFPQVPINVTNHVQLRTTATRAALSQKREDSFPDELASEHLDAIADEAAVKAAIASAKQGAADLANQEVGRPLRNADTILNGVPEPISEETKEVKSDLLRSSLSTTLGWLSLGGISETILEEGFEAWDGASQNLESVEAARAERAQGRDTKRTVGNIQTVANWFSVAGMVSDALGTAGLATVGLSALKGLGKSLEKAGEGYRIDRAILFGATEAGTGLVGGMFVDLIANTMDIADAAGSTISQIDINQDRARMRGDFDQLLDFQRQITTLEIEFARRDVLPTAQFLEVLENTKTRVEAMEERIAWLDGKQNLLDNE